MQARVQAVGQTLWGYYYLPSNDASPIDFKLNPSGMEDRSKLR